MLWIFRDLLVLIVEMQMLQRFENEYDDTFWLEL